MVSLSTSTGGPLAFTVENLGSPDLDPVVYISRDPQWGKLSLAIRNPSSDQVIHVDTGSLLTVRLDSLLTTPTSVRSSSSPIRRIGRGDPSPGTTPCCSSCVQGGGFRSGRRIRSRSRSTTCWPRVR